MVFRPVLEPSWLSLCVCVCSLGLVGSEVNDAQVGSCRGCFMMSWLDGDSFPRGMMRWTG
jgi:hypothetical protein